jgi:hypothetical protein
MIHNVAHEWPRFWWEEERIVGAVPVETIGTDITYSNLQNAYQDLLGQHNNLKYLILSD